MDRVSSKNLVLILVLASAWLSAQEVATGVRTECFLLGYPRLERPLPVTVLIDSKSAFEGELIAEPVAANGVVPVRRRVKFSQGRYRFLLAPTIPDLTCTRIRVRLVPDQGNEFQTELPLPPYDCSRRVAVLATMLPSRAVLPFANLLQRTKAQEELETVAASRNARILPRRISPIVWEQSPSKPYRTLPAFDRIHQLDLSPLRLPRQVQGYSAIDALLLDASIELNLLASQQRALEDWIAAGGTLFLVTTSGKLQIKSPVPRLFPNLLLREEREGILRTFTPVDSDSPMAVVHGKGSIRMLPIDFRQGKELDSKKLKRLLPIAAPIPLSRDQWNAVCAAVNADPGLLRSYNEPSRDTPYWPLWQWFHGLDLRAAGVSHLARALRKTVGFKTLEFRPILLLAIVYILVLVVLDYALLRRFRRLRWTWITCPIIIAAFTIYAYLNIYQGKLGEEERFEFVIRDVGPKRTHESVFVCARMSSERPCRLPAYPQSNILPCFGDDGATTLCIAGDGARSVQLSGLVGSARYFREDKSYASQAAAPELETIDLSSKKLSSAWQDYLADVEAAAVLFRGKLTHLKGDEKLLTYAAGDMHMAIAETQSPLYIRHQSLPGAAAVASQVAPGYGVLITVTQEPVNKPGWGNTRMICCRQIVKAWSKPDEQSDVQDEPVTQEVW